MASVGVFPGSFNPLTVAHLAIAHRAKDEYKLDRLDLVVSRRALAKQEVVHPRFEHRIQVLHDAAAEIGWLTVVVTDKQLLVDIARGYDRLVVGADKWWQIQQVEWYDSVAARDAAMAQLPPAAVVPRSHFTHPPRWALELNDDAMAEVSSTRARQGEIDLMAPAARRFAALTGAWIDPEAYERWLDEADKDQ